MVRNLRAACSQSYRLQPGCAPTHLVRRVGHLVRRSRLGLIWCVQVESMSPPRLDPKTTRTVCPHRRRRPIRTSYYLLPTTYSTTYSTTYYLLPTIPTTYYSTYYLLPTTYYLLPTVLPTTYYLQYYLQYHLLYSTTYYLLPTVVPTTVPTVLLEFSTVVAVHFYLPASTITYSTSPPATTVPYCTALYSYE